LLILLLGGAGLGGCCYDWRLWPVVRGWLRVAGPFAGMLAPTRLEGSCPGGAVARCLAARGFSLYVVQAGSAVTACPAG
jgi:hypothetical protein